MEIKEMIIPENWECIIENGIATFREKKQNPPRSWEEFCERYPVQDGEYFITPSSSIVGKTDWACDFDRHPIRERNWCISREEAKAFLALMQLRQLRKAWVGNWEQIPHNDIGYILYDIKVNRLATGFGKFSCFITLSFPSCGMAEDFLDCFRDLCETAKTLL